MKCLNCGGEDFEKAEHDGQFTTAFSYRRVVDFTSKEKTVIVPRYFHACLKCGFVHQMLDLEVRRVEMKNLIDYALEDRLTEPDPEDYRNFRIERINMREVSEFTNIPRPLLDELARELLQGHKGYDTIQLRVGKCKRVIPVLEEDEGMLWIIGQKK